MAEWFVFWLGMTMNGRFRAAWQMLQQRWGGFCIKGLPQPA